MGRKLDIEAMLGLRQIAAKYSPGGEPHWWLALQYTPTWQTHGYLRRSTRIDRMTFALARNELASIRVVRV